MGDNTKQSIRKTLAVILLMAVCCLVFSQDTQINSSENQNEELISNLKSIESGYTFSNNSANNVSSGTENDSGQASSSGASSSAVAGSGSTVWLFVRMILVLVLVIACIYGIVWLLKKSMRPGAENDPYLKKTASITLAPGKTVQIVTLQDKAYLLGVSDSSITLISEIDDKELIDTMNLNAPVGGNSKKPADFASLLASLTGSAKRTERFLRSKREDLNNGGRNR